MRAGPAPARPDRAGRCSDAGRRASRSCSRTRSRSPPASRATRGFTGTVLAEPAPYDTSRAYGLESRADDVPARPRRVGRGRRWSAGTRGALSALVGQACALRRRAALPEITDEPPRRSPAARPSRPTTRRCWRCIERAGAARRDGGHVRARLDRRPAGRPADAATRVDAMLGGRDPRRSLGDVPPGMGEATLERVAACAVLAGCRPEYFPVVRRGRGGRARPGLQPPRPGGDDPAGRASSWSSTGRSREAIGLQQRHGRARPGMRGRT